MSVINRMLTDLEHRGGHTAVGAPDLQPADRSRRRRLPTSRLATIGLAVALVAVASVLWLQRGPAVADQVRVALQGPGEDGPVEIVAYQPDTEARPGARRADEVADGAGAGVRDGDGGAATEIAAAGGLAPPADPLQARLATLRFEAEHRDAVALVLEFAGEPPPVSLPRVDDDTVAVRFAAPADGVAVPSPPGDQDLFRALSVQSVDGGGELRVQLAAGTRIGLEPGDNASLRLAARGANTGAGQDADAAMADTAVAVIEPRSAEEGETGSAHSGEATSAAGEETAAEDADSAGTASTASASESSQSEAPGTAASATNAEATASEPVADPAPLQVAEGEYGSVRSDDRASDEVLARRRYSDARDALAAGDTRRARRLLEQAVDYDPDLHSARDVLVTLLRRAGDNTAAREQLAAGLEQAPARASFAKPYARMRVDDGAYAHARDVLEAARINAEGELDFHALLANVHRRLGDHGAAIGEYTEALEIDSSQASLWLGLGISLAAHGHGNQAQSAFREARATGQLSDRLDRWAEQKIEDLARSEGGA